MFCGKFHEVLLNGVKFGVWCAMSAARIIGSILFLENVTLLRQVTHNDALCLNICPNTNEPMHLFLRP